MDTAWKLYKELQAKGIEAMIDDRDERAGVKFKDADLLGIPLRITAGRQCGRGLVELKVRGASGARELGPEEAIAEVVREINAAVG